VRFYQRDGVGGMTSDLIFPARALSRIMLLIALVAQGITSLGARDAGRAQLLPVVKGTDCVTCHRSDSILPLNHTNIVGKTLGDCATCHAPGTALELTGRMPLFHHHLLSGLTCVSCHADPKAPEITAADVCMGCHNPEKVSTATATMKPANPHSSPHYGTKADCNICHHQHERSENYCLQCHNKFVFKVP